MLHRWGCNAINYAHWIPFALKQCNALRWDAIIDAGVDAPFPIAVLRALRSVLKWMLCQIENSNQTWIAIGRRAPFPNGPANPVTAKLGFQLKFYVNFAECARTVSLPALPSTSFTFPADISNFRQIHFLILANLPSTHFHLQASVSIILRFTLSPFDRSGGNGFLVFAQQLLLDPGKNDFFATRAHSFR